MHVGAQSVHVNVYKTIGIIGHLPIKDNEGEEAKEVKAMQGHRSTIMRNRSTRSSLSRLGQ